MPEQLVLIIHVLVALAILGLIMLQQGKGAEAGASFGGGASQTVLGVAGGGNMLTRWTSILAAVFFATSLTLGYFAKQKSEGLGQMQIEVPALEAISVPVNDEIPVLDVVDVPSVDAADVPAVEAKSVPE
ncbi:MAG: preprotein translocase subunit SecG [Pseudomonadales bacterium]|nr:preprotein translocase subunit SecG [Pseudomonadales bacterium]